MQARTEALDHVARAVDGSQVRRKLGAGWLIAPAIAFLSLFYLYPLVHLIFLSFGGARFTVEYYEAFFGDATYLKILAKTFQLSLTTTILTLLIGYPVAYLLAHAPRRMRNPLLILVIVPYLTSFLVRTYAWIVLLNDRGIINAGLLKLGITSEPIKLVYNSFGVHVGMVHVMLPLMILPLYGVMSGIDPRLMRASHSLGASPSRTFFKIYLPLSLPGVRSGSLLVFLICLGFYITPAMLGGIGNLMLVNIIDSQVTRLGNWEFGAAASMTLLVLTIVGFFIIGKLAGAADVFVLNNPTVRVAGATKGKPTATQASGLWSGISQSSFGWKVYDRLAAIRARRWRSGRERQTPPIEMGRPLLYVFCALAFVFLILPTFVVIPISFSSANFLTFPPPGWSLRWYETFFSKKGWIDGTLVSLQVAFATTVFATFVGTLAAYALVRGAIPRKRLLMSVIVSPIIVPSMVIGVAIYGVFVDWALLGKWYGLVLAHSIGALAYVVVIVGATLTRYDFSLERAAMSLGASPWRTFYKITLPIIRPGVVAGALFAFIHSFDELVIAMLVSGIRTKTLPARMWQNIRNEIDPTIAAISTMLILLPVVWLVILEINRRMARSNDGAASEPLWG